MNKKFSWSKICYSKIGPEDPLKGDYRFDLKATRSNVFQTDKFGNEAGTRNSWRQLKYKTDWFRSGGVLTSIAWHLRQQLLKRNLSSIRSDSVMLGHSDFSIWNEQPGKKRPFCQIQASDCLSLSRSRASDFTLTYQLNSKTNPMFRESTAGDENSMSWDNLRWNSGCGDYRGFGSPRQRGGVAIRLTQSI